MGREKGYKPSIRSIKEKGGSFYIDYDDNLNGPGVFDTEFGFCWATCNVENVCEELNKELTKGKY